MEENNTKNTELNMERIWSMPRKNTFEIPPLKKLLNEYLNTLPQGAVILNPFANTSKLGTFTNDIDTQYDTDYHLDALVFLKQFKDDSVDAVLFDPPFSPRQVSECYKKLGMTVNMQTTQASYWSNLKKEIGRIVKSNGFVVTCGWNSGGIGQKYGFQIEKIMLIAHGGWHNDTIITVDRKQ